MEGDANNNLFVKDGRPVRFLFHSSVREGIKKITRDIQTHGGEVVEDEEDTDVVLVDEESDIELIRRRYYSNPELFRLRIFVEPRGFVRRCIRSGVYEHRGLKRMEGMPGKRNGRAPRTPFTLEDDKHLAHYMATIFPDAEAGGRMGNLHYRNLEHLQQFPEFEWVSRHTWHSWRERYKKNAKWFDREIAEAAAQLEPYVHGHGFENRSRKYKNRREYKDSNEEDEDVEQEGEEDEGTKVKVEKLESEEPDETANVQATPPSTSQTHARTSLEKRNRSHDSPAHNHWQLGDDFTSPKRARIPQTERQQEKETSPVIQGDDLFGDYESNMKDAERPGFRSPEPVYEDDPEMTQRTLVGTPRSSHNDGHIATQMSDRRDNSRRRNGRTKSKVEMEVSKAAHEDAPYRNTRARSRSIEPQVIGGVSTRDNANVKNRTTRGRARGMLEDVPETKEGDLNGRTDPVPDSELEPELELVSGRQSSTASQHASLGIGETYEEERAVQDLLEDAVSLISLSSGLLSSEDERNVLSRFQDVEMDVVATKEEEEEPSDEDDAETYRVLKEASEQVRQLDEYKREDESEGEGQQGSSDSSVMEEEDERVIKERLARMSNARLTRARHPQNGPGPSAHIQTRSSAVAPPQGGSTTARTARGRVQEKTTTVRLRHR